MTPKLERFQSTAEKVAQILEELNPVTWEQTILNIAKGKSDAEITQIAEGYNSAIRKMGLEKTIEFLNAERIEEQLANQK